MKPNLPRRSMLAVGCLAALCAAASARRFQTSPRMRTSPREPKPAM